jgi:hypothetical protein
VTIEGRISTPASDSHWHSYRVLARDARGRTVACDDDVSGEDGFRLSVPGAGLYEVVCECGVSTGWSRARVRWEKAAPAVRVQAPSEGVVFVDPQGPRGRVPPPFAKIDPSAVLEIEGRLAVASEDLPYARIEAKGRDLTRDGIVRADGGFRVEGLLPGVYEMCVEAGPQRWSCSGVAAGAQDVVLRPPP